MSEEPEVQILAVEFNDGYDMVEISYIERRNIAKKAFKRESITIDPSILHDPADVTEVIILLTDMIDEAMRHIRREAD